MITRSKWKQRNTFSAIAKAIDQAALDAAPTRTHGPGPMLAARMALDGGASPAADSICAAGSGLRQKQSPADSPWAAAFEFNPVFACRKPTP
jgi:hypothetical protein